MECCWKSLYIDLCFWSETSRWSQHMAPHTARGCWSCKQSQRLSPQPMECLNNKKEKAYFLPWSISTAWCPSRSIRDGQRYHEFFPWKRLYLCCLAIWKLLMFYETVPRSTLHGAWPTTLLWGHFLCFLMHRIWGRNSLSNFFLFNTFFGGRTRCRSVTWMEHIPIRVNMKFGER